MATVGLLAQPVGAYFGGKRGKGLSRPQFVPLALAPGRLAARTEDRLQVFPARLVGGHDGDRGFRCRHAHEANADRAIHVRSVPVNGVCGGHLGRESTAPTVRFRRWTTFRFQYPADDPV
jgi:hypothetical protein